MVSYAEPTEATHPPRTRLMSFDGGLPEKRPYSRLNCAALGRAAKLLGVTWRAAQQNIDKLIDANILREITGQKRNRIFLAEEIVRSIEA